MRKIQLDGKNYVLLDHRKLINAAYNVTGSQEYTIRPELFEFHAKAAKHAENDLGAPRKKRRKEFPDTPIEIRRITEILRTIPDFFPLEKCVPEKTLARVWEQSSANDFPKFKGTNNTTSFQVVDNLVDGVQFVIPPASRFYNYNVADFIQHVDELPAPFDLIVLDPPWRNKYIRRLKRHHLGYDMLESKQLQDIPIGKLINEKSIVAIWCTNSKQHQEDLLQQILPAWQLRFLYAFKWLKLNTLGEPINNSATEDTGKQPFEMLYIACHRDADEAFGVELKDVEMLMSIPSIIHSHKPPLLEWLRSHLLLGENPNCLEVFARYLQPNFTSFGLEVLKLMDTRLYTKSEEIISNSS